MAAVVSWYILAIVVGWLGVVVWLTAKGEMEFSREDLRASLRLHAFAWMGVVMVPLLVGYMGARSRLTVGGCIVAVLAWLAFFALLRWVRRPPAPRAGAGGGTQTPS